MGDSGEGGGSESLELLDLDPKLTIINQEIKGCIRRNLPQWVREKDVNTLSITCYPSRERAQCTFRIVTGSDCVH